MKFFLIYNKFFCRVVFFFHEDVLYLKIKIEKSEKSIPANLESCIVFLIAIFAYLLLWLSKQLYAKQIKLPEDDWLVETSSFSIGDFIFMLNTDWIVKKQMSIPSFIYINSRKNI